VPGVALVELGASGITFTLSCLFVRSAQLYASAEIETLKVLAHPA
jgi:hypothetical protein